MNQHSDITAPWHKAILIVATIVFLTACGGGSSSSRGGGGQNSLAPPMLSISDAQAQETDSGVVVVLEEDFDFDGAPDPKLGFGKDGTYDHGSQISHLGSNKGRQVYEVPASTDPEAYNQFYVWCEKYSVPLGVADLE